jgi:hypothetical protein
VVGGVWLLAMAGGDRIWRTWAAEVPRTGLKFLCFLGTFVLLAQYSCLLYPLSTYMYLYESLYGILNYQYRYVGSKKHVLLCKSLRIGVDLACALGGVCEFVCVVVVLVREFRYYSLYRKS